MVSTEISPEGRTYDIRWKRLLCLAEVESTSIYVRVITSILNIKYLPCLEAALDPVTHAGICGINMYE